MAATMAFAQHLDILGLEPARVEDAVQTTPRALRVGDRLDPASIHPVMRPGLYGISGAPAGSRYGIVDGRLIRYDGTMMEVQSIIRPVDFILD